uniref:Uncharacterized protein n=1 Tax=viral metagenome TaxID=1070528 RepID=A0A6C0KAR7_9ZZZZ
MPTISMFLFVMFLIIITSHIMVCLMSCCYKREDDDYVNPYRLVPRKEAESYKRYERQMYNDSLRNKRRKC